MKEDDFVLFLKQDSFLGKTYEYGMVVSVQESNEDVIRKVKVKYWNAKENVDRETLRSVRQLVMIHYVDEIDIIKEIYNIYNWHNLVAPSPQALRFVAKIGQCNVSLQCNNYSLNRQKLLFFCFNLLR